MSYRNIPLEVSQEYEEALPTVIRGYARMGYSKNMTAKVLRMHHVTLNKWLDLLNLGGLFSPANYNESCRSYGTWRPGRERIYSDTDLLKEVIRYGGSSYQYRKDHHAGAPHILTIINRFGSWKAAKLKAKEMFY